MAICKGCNGVLGRDCFNESECLYIVRTQSQMYERDQHEHYLSVDQAVGEINGLNIQITMLTDHISALTIENDCLKKEVAKRDFMIENGLGWEDLRNDITPL